MKDVEFISLHRTMLQPCSKNTVIAKCTHKQTNRSVFMYFFHTSHKRTKNVKKHEDQINVKKHENQKFANAEKRIKTVQ